MKEYVVIIGPAGANWSGYVPDLPGCVATGATREAVERELHDAIEFHIEGLRADQLPVPTPSSSASYVEVSA